MSCPEYLIEEIFPIKIYEHKYYKANISTNEKIYLAILENCNFDFRKADTVMLDMISRPRLNSIKKHLAELNFIKLPHTTSAEEGKKITIKNSHKGFVCEWCGNQCYVLQKHHYPIPQSKGGKDTVNICPNCHYTYHYIMGGSYE